MGVMMGKMISVGTSGGHLNPAVTTAFALTSKISWKKVPFYLAGQYLGAFTASALIFATYHGN